MAELKVTQFKSAIGSKPKQRGTLRALGLGRIGKTNTLPDRPEIRGMLAKVPHLVKVERGAHDDQGPRPEARPGSTQEARSASAAAPAAAGARPPAAARRARAPAAPSR